MHQTSKLLFCIHVLITQQVKIQLKINGRGFWMLFWRRIILLDSTTPIKVSPQEIWILMLGHSDSLPNILTDSVFSNHLPKTLVYMVKELVTSIS